VTINDGQPFTNQAAVILALEFPATAYKLEGGSSADFSNARLLPLQSQVKWLLDERVVGEQPVYVRYWDTTGMVSFPASASIVYDPIPPVGNVKVVANNGLSLLVNVEAWDPLSGVAAMAIGFTPEDLTWQTFSPVVKLVLPSGVQGTDSTPVVYARFRDHAGNESPIYRSDESATGRKLVYIPLTIGGR
jgi:hypothetical protein